MKLFNKPSWLKPEINELRYWLHVFILVFVIYYLVNTFVQPMEITTNNVFLGALFLGIADVIAHTILGLD